MARKIICPECNTIFDEDVLKQKNSENTCLVCGGSLNGEKESDHEESPSFGEDVVLGEDDSFDEGRIDYWWYSMVEPGEVWRGITFEYGEVNCNCAKCGNFSGTAPYPIAKTGDYLLIDSNYTSTCSHCGNKLKNHILSKRPESWVDPRQHDIWEKDYDHLPKCPICSSTKIHKISITNKAASIVAFGIFSAGHVSKTYKCDICGSKF